MSTLARLRDLAGCRAVLRDAQEEQRPPEMIADLERQLQETVAALCDGGVRYRTVLRVAPRRRDVSESAFHDAVYNLDADGEDTHAAWSAEMIAEWKGSIRRFQRSDLLAWCGQPRRERSGWMGVDRQVIAGTLRERYAEDPAPPGGVTGLAAWLPDRAHPALTMAAGHLPDTVVMSPRNYEVLQRESGKGSFRALVRRVLERAEFAHLADAALYARKPSATCTAASPAPPTPADVFGDGREWTRSLTPAEPGLRVTADSDAIEIRMRNYANIMMSPWVGVIDVT